MRTPTDILTYGILDTEAVALMYLNVYFDDFGALDKEFEALATVVDVDEVAQLKANMSSIYNRTMTMVNTLNHVTNALSYGEMNSLTVYKALVDAYATLGYQQTAGVNMAETHKVLKRSLTQAKKQNLKLAKLEAACEGLGNFTDKQLLQEVREVINRFGKRTQPEKALAALNKELEAAYASAGYKVTLGE